MKRCARFDYLLRVWALSAGILLASFFWSGPAYGWSFPSQQIADRASSYAVGSGQGQCKVFAANVINTVMAANGIGARVGGYGTPGGAYYGAYQNAGGSLVAVNSGQPGDLVQTIRADQKNLDYPTTTGLHTAIIVRVVSPGVYIVRDSNWNLDERVFEHQWNPQTWAADKGATAYVWRFGQSGVQFIRATDNGQVYRVVGGAPVYVSSWANVGGQQPTVSRTRAQIDAMPRYPKDDTYVRAGTRVYVIVGGAPVYVSSWAAVGGSRPTIQIDPVAIDRADGASPWNHLRRYPVNASLVRAGTHVYRMAGGSPQYVSSWTAIGGQKPAVRIDPAAIGNAHLTVAPWGHVRRYPSDGTILRAGPTGVHYRTSGGVARRTTLTGGAVVVDSRVISNAGAAAPWDHLLGASRITASSGATVHGCVTNVSFCRAWMGVYGLGTPVKMECWIDGRSATGLYTSSRWFLVRRADGYEGFVHSSWVGAQTSVGWCGSSLRVKAGLQAAARLGQVYPSAADVTAGGWTRIGSLTNSNAFGPKGDWSGDAAKLAWISYWRAGRALARGGSWNIFQYHWDRSATRGTSRFAPYGALVGWRWSPGQIGISLGGNRVASTSGADSALRPNDRLFTTQDYGGPFAGWVVPQ